MKIRLLDYMSHEHFVEIPDDTQQIDIKIVSGDMIMTSPIRYDTSDSREINYNDGEFTLQKEQFSILDTAKNTFDFKCKMYDWDDE